LATSMLKKRDIPRTLAKSLHCFKQSIVNWRERAIFKNALYQF
jgi:hypothetical protein